MTNITASNENDLRYTVMVHGQPVGPKYPTPEAANAAVLLLSEAHQSIAEVVPVTADGGQLLLGYPFPSCQPSYI